VVLFASCLLRTSIADIPLERDEGEYGYIAQRWLAGELPYQSSFNQKFPGTFLAYAVITGILGESPGAIHWGAQVWSMATLTLVFLLGWRLFSAPAGIAAAAFAALLVGDYTVLGNAANTETFAILFFAGSFLAALNAVGRDSLAWSFAAGALGAAGMVCKQPGVFNLAFVVLYIAWATKLRVARIAATIAGAAAVLGLVFLYFAANGAWGDFYDNTIGHNLSYAARVPLEMYPELFWLTFSKILGSFWPVYLLAAWGLLGPVIRRSAPAAAGTPNPNLLANALAVLVWLGFCCLAVSVGGYFRHHYFIQIIPAVALLAGLGVTQVAPSAGRFGERLPYVLCGLATVYVVSMAPWYYLPGSAEEKCRRLYADNPFPESQEIAQFIAANSSPGDSVLVVGSEPQILHYSKRRSATRYILMYPLMTPFPDSADRQKSVLEEIRRNDPKFVVTVFIPQSFLLSPETPTTLFDGVRAHMSGRYTPVGAVVPTGQPGQRPRLQFRAEPAVAAAYKARPFWYESGSIWTTVLVWQRDEPAPAPAPSP
jgi:hypothetical protein